MPTLRRLAARGAVAEGMRPVNPTVTWPNHTSMITGVTPAKHGVMFNGLLVREPGVPPRVEPWRDKERDGARADALRRRARARPDDGAGGLGGDLERADGHVGVSASARSPKGADRAARWSRRARLAGRMLETFATQEHRLARSHLDARRRRTSSGSTGRT